MISTVVFDFDGTLVDSNAIKRQGFFDVVARHEGGVARMERILGSQCGDRRSLFAAYVADCASRGAPLPDDVDALVQAYSERTDASVAAASEMPGATVILRKLRERRVRLYVSSATPESALRDLIHRRGWSAWFEGIFGHPTKKRDAVRGILEGTGISPAALAVVGDGEDDRESAASVRCAFFPVGEARGLQAGERVFTLHEVCEHLLNSGAEGAR